MPNLPLLELTASEQPDRTVALSAMTAAVLFTCLDAANRWYDWTGAAGELTDAEKDEIDAILGLARHELMQFQLGEIKATVAATIPAGCLLCDGGIYDRVDYPDLYAVLSPAYIVDADQFRTPELRSTFPQGGTEGVDIGETGGEASVTLSVGEIPAHSHAIPRTITTIAFEPGEVTVLSPVPFFDDSTGDTGGTGSHNNIPPYVKLLYFIVAV